MAERHEVRSLTDSTEEQTSTLKFHGNGGTLFGIFLVNQFLTIVTLGLYRFWGKVKVQQYLWSQSEFAGDRFAYHGTGRELLIGWLKAIGCFIVLPGLVGFIVLWLSGLITGEVQLSGPVLTGLLVLGAILAFGLLQLIAAVVIVGGRRYRLSRTSWRGIRLSFRGCVRELVRLNWRNTFFTMFTLGLYTPFAQTLHQAFLVTHTYVGNRPWSFDGQGRDLLGSFLGIVAVTLLCSGVLHVLEGAVLPPSPLPDEGALIALALLFDVLQVAIPWGGVLWFTAVRRRYFWNHTRIGTARFRCTLSPGHYLFLKMSNLLILVVTVGLGRAWTMVRAARFTLRYLVLEGSLDVAGIQQEAQAASAVGEGLGSIFDFLDSGFDLG